jgi:small subunit ribosomal protein S4
VVEVRAKSKQMALVMEAISANDRDFPAYMDVDTGALKGKYIRAPKFADVPYPVTMEPNLVVEFYSR